MMKRILVAWELGANFGHIAQLQPIADSLRRQGYEVTFAMRDLTHARRLLGLNTYRIVAAPMPPPLASPTEHTGPPESYLDILALQGAADPDSLSAIIYAWQDLLDLGRFDLLLAESAPFAVLAASLMDLPHMALGTGFTLPPAQTPFPFFRQETVQSRSRRGRTETVILHALNVLANARGQPQFRYTYEIFRSAARYLITWPELDHYGPRERDNFLGPLHTSQSAKGDMAIDWPSGNGRVVGYLQPDYPQLAMLLSTLTRSGLSSIVAIPGGDRWAREYASSTLRIPTARVQLDRLLIDADFVICHGSHNLAAESLLHGKPLMMLPQQIEQAMLAKRIQSSQFGAYLSPTETRRIPELVQHMRKDYSREANEAFALAKRSYVPSETAQIISTIASTMM
ncbi:glycosyltransferase family protein [Cupriavidus pampae]|nr:hypothetical protein [Cupriavidus pampae]